MRSVLQQLIKGSNPFCLCVCVWNSARGENSYAHQNDMQVGRTVVLHTAHDQCYNVSYYFSMHALSW